MLLGEGGVGNSHVTLFLGGEEVHRLNDYLRRNTNKEPRSRELSVKE